LKSAVHTSLSARAWVPLHIRPRSRATRLSLFSIKLSELLHGRPLRSAISATRSCSSRAFHAYPARVLITYSRHSSRKLAVLIARWANSLP
jgi:hypothetical protein